MKPHFSLFIGGLMLFGVRAAAAPSPQSIDPNQSRPQTCEGCHAEAHDEVVPLADGTFLGVWVDTEALGRSVHGTDFTCTDCHRQIGPYPHAPSTYETRRELRVTLSKTCNRCHYSHFESVLDSMHFAQLEAGHPEAPTCVDCHGSHEIKEAKQPRADINAGCATCHEDVEATYAASVHGAALLEGNEDVPVCTDCHGAHRIEDPKSPTFHAGEHEVCAKCHADPERMEPYELSHNVLSTYLDDFHGSSNQLYRKVGTDSGRPVATCSDCHGVHDIRSMKDRDEVASIEGRSRQMCASCHEGASDDFAAAWLSHQDPTLQKTPLVWSIKWGYRIMIPLIMLGLVLHILIDLVQVRTHRDGSQT